MWVMPNWQPKWDDVQFDHGEANEAVLLCQGALVTLGDRHAVLQGPYQMACVNWRGVKRYRFDAEWMAMHSQAEAVAEQLRAHIVKLQHESAAAITEQRLREAQRAQWFREKATEEAAAAAAREAARIAAAQQAAAQAAQAAQQAATAPATAAALATQTETVKSALVFAPITTWPTSPAVQNAVTSSPSVSSSSGSYSPVPIAAEPPKPVPASPPRASGQLSGR
jgi:cobalamin biosynthesis Mg chelatase CobN